MEAIKCSCGGVPEAHSETYGWEAGETTTYHYRCSVCNRRLGWGESRQEALESWNVNRRYEEEHEDS